MHNEALEFLGDSVLGLVVAEYLHRQHPTLTEGELSRMKHQLVSTETLAGVAETLGIGDHLRFGRGEEKTGGRKKRALLADGYEAVLAAIYLDGSIKAATEFVHRTLENELSQASPEGAAAADTKTALQELLQADGRAAPAYDVVEMTGPPHRRTFHVEVRWDAGVVRGQGRSRKAAEMQAAARALEQLGKEQNGDAEQISSVAPQPTASANETEQPS